MWSSRSEIDIIKLEKLVKQYEPITSALVPLHDGNLKQTDAINEQTNLIKDMQGVPQLQTLQEKPLEDSIIPNNERAYISSMTNRY